MMLTTAPVVKCFYHLTPLYPVGLSLALWPFLPVSILDVSFLGLSPAILLLGYLWHTTIPGLLIKASMCW